MVFTYLGFDSQFGFTDGLSNTINIHLKLHKIKITHTKSMKICREDLPVVKRWHLCIFIFFPTFIYLSRWINLKFGITLIHVYTTKGIIMFSLHTPLEVEFCPCLISQEWSNHLAETLLQCILIPVNQYNILKILTSRILTSLIFITIIWVNLIINFHFIQTNRHM